MTQAPYVVFDLETGPDPFGEPFDEAFVSLGARKRPETIRSYIEECRTSYLEEAALSATTGEILLAGIYWRPDAEYVILEGDESLMLVNFWETLSKFRENELAPRFVGFNCLGFDLPFAIRRSWKHAVEVPDFVFDGRYVDRSFTDLLLWWGCGNRQDKISLDRFARFLGLEPKQGKGKEFANLYRSDPVQAISYLKHDLWLTGEIAARLSV